MLVCTSFFQRNTGLYFVASDREAIGSLSVFVKGSDSSDFKGLCSETKLVTEYPKKSTMKYS